MDFANFKKAPTAFEEGSQTRAKGKLAGYAADEGGLPADRYACFKVGTRLPGYLPGSSMEGVRFSATMRGLTLYAMFRSPTAVEIDHFRRGRFGFGLLPAGRHTAFVLSTVTGGAFGPRWTDAPFSLGLVPEGERGLPARPRGSADSYAVHCVLADPADGIIHAQRLLALPSTFCDEFQDEVERQRRKLWAWSEQAHADEVAAAYRRWPTPEDMVLAVGSGTGGAR